MKLFFSDPTVEENYYYGSIVKMKNGEIIDPTLPKFWGLKADQEILDSPKSLFLQENININQVDELVVKFYHLSPEFDFFYERAFENNLNLGNQFSNQLPPWTNIIGGYGFIGAYQVDSLTIQL